MYLSARGAVPSSLLLSDDHKPLTHGAFSTIVSSRLEELGLLALHHGTYSLQIGNATSAKNTDISGIYAGPPRGFWWPRALTRNEALDHTCGGYCVKYS